jgi:hypothetical protein
MIFGIVNEIKLTVNSLHDLILNDQSPSDKLRETEKTLDEASETCMISISSEMVHTLRLAEKAIARAMVTKESLEAMLVRQLKAGARPSTPDCPRFHLEEQERSYQRKTHIVFDE